MNPDLDAQEHDEYNSENTILGLQHGNHETRETRETREIRKKRKMREMREKRKMREMRENREIREKEREKDASEFNTYASKKSVSQEILNTTSMQYLIGLIVSILTTQKQPYDGLTIASIVMIGTSLLLQSLVFILIALIYKETKLQAAKPKNTLVTTLSTVVLIVNIAITIVTVRLNVPAIGSMIRSEISSLLNSINPFV